jgi:Zn finger protein HypA/HybF involved in hydrogenase expression
VHERGPIASAIASLEGLDRPQRIEVALGPSMERSVAVAAWEHLVDGTALGDVAVEWTSAFDLLACLVCSAEYRGEKVDTCPECGGDGLIVEPALDVDIRILEVAD